MKKFQEIIEWIKKNRNSETKVDVENWNKFWMPVIGFFALIWFLIRVIPKPSRFRYPCQRAAAPLAMGFLAWLSITLGLSFSINKIIAFIKKSRYWAAAGILIITLAAVGTYIGYNIPYPVTARQQGPLGQGKGIYPGRVAWNYNAAAAVWDGESDFWWDDTNTNQKVVAKMWQNSLTVLTGEDNPSSAWKALFTNFNHNNRNLDRDYQDGETIAVKLNLNTNKSHQDRDNEVDLSPQMVYVLVESLIEDGEISPQNIYLYDASRPVADKFYKKVNDKYPRVKFVDTRGGEGRQKVKVDKSSPVYYTGVERKQVDYLPQSVVKAEYLINLASLKKHSLAGVTLTAKNHFGSIYNKNYSSWTPSHLHSYINAGRRRMATPNPLVSLMGHKDLGGKTLLYIIDGLYGGMNQQSVKPNRWSMPPFNGGWSSSIFLSQDPVAIDSVAFDFLRTETELMDYTENYLHEAALAGSPASKAVYDPEKDGNTLRSLGVHEHWNNSKDKLYGGNNNTEKNGIELIKVHKIK